jgi:hypothetical protein
MIVELNELYELPITKEFGKRLFGKTYFLNHAVVSKKLEGEFMVKWLIEYEYNGSIVKEEFGIKLDGTMFRRSNFFNQNIMKHMPCYRALQILEYINEQI